MNVLVFSWRDPKHPLAGGAEQVMHEHMKGWVKEGHSVTFFSSHFKGAPKEEEFDGVFIIRQGSHLFLDVQIKALFWYLYAKHPKFDLIVDQFHGYPFFTPLYTRIKKLSVLQEVAREVWLINELKPPLNWIIGWIGYLTEPLIFRLFYTKVPFMVGSQSAKEDLTKMGISKDNIHTIPHGVIIKAPTKLPAKEKKKTIIFLGAIAKDKGIEDAIKCFAILNKIDDFNFWVVGKGDPLYVRKLKTIAEKLGVNKNLKVFGFVSQEKKFELLAKAHVLVNPSVREGWGLVNIEANAMGTPVAAYNSPGLTDSVKDNHSGILCKQNTPEEMAKVVRNILDQNNYEDYSKNSIKWSKNFSWEKSKKLSLSLLNKVANQD